MSVDIRIGDCRHILAAMPSDSVDCVVTSPPYLGLRDYGVAGQMGLEPTLAEHIAGMVSLFEEVRRVLKPEGTLWLNYGDTYAQHKGGSVPPAQTVAGGVGGQGGQKERRGMSEGYNPSRDPSAHGLKPKDLCMVPNRIAIAMQEAGWWVRSEIIWAKPNPMPESVTDRPATSHEKIWLLTKSARYFYDAEAVREPAAESSEARWAQDIENQKGSDRAHAGGKTNGPMKAVGGKQRGHGRRHDGFNDRWDTMSKAEQQANGHNCRNVWTIATKPFSEAHFATFPPELAERCIKAGCPKGGTVLDPFGGAGTTGLVADRLGRNAILIELNPAYAAMASNRIRDDLPMFAEVKSA